LEIRLDKLDAVTPQNDPKGKFMPEFPVAHQDGSAAWRQKREPTKLECGLLGALSATIVLAILFWLGTQLSVLSLIVHIN
jgi:hypothetical protein